MGYTHQVLEDVITRAVTKALAADREAVKEEQREIARRKLEMMNAQFNAEARRGAAQAPWSST